MRAFGGTFRIKAVLLAIVPVSLARTLFLLNGGALSFHADRGWLSRSD